MEHEAVCPYCGEDVTLWVEAPNDEIETRYTEDCPVCCRPWVVVIRRDHDGDPHVYIGHQDG